MQAMCTQKYGGALHMICWLSSSCPYIFFIQRNLLPLSIKVVIIDWTPPKKITTPLNCHVVLYMVRDMSYLSDDSFRAHHTKSFCRQLSCNCVKFTQGPSQIQEEFQYMKKFFLRKDSFVFNFFFILFYFIFLNI